MRTTETLARAPGSVDLWYCTLDATSPVPEGEGVMSAEERSSCERLHFDVDRRACRVTRLLVRSVLSKYHPIPPAVWSFSKGARGKPYVAGPRGAPPLSFNLTNTRELVACAVSAAHDRIGVDAERVNRDVDAEGVAREHFSSGELAELALLDGARRRARFFDYWTLKESYAKALGMGLSLRLDAATFSISGDGVTLRFAPPAPEDAANWAFALLRAEPDHVVAIAADTRGAPLRLRATRVTPSELLSSA
ncbi:MAG TPA: 4'-phosphopantetheinyl transferase superfamily protein [Polyangiaceae bacterium]|nr:4'-phosphopantetheinyl transferase superfamily protein [Polyangiaceae bacterium]